ncbi:4548_t:CDS:2 [Funneliformis mosseae]|uniref:4548_t:CDS:1 n=1 Tax=Funneliformis mosseae TaxID=27381 RepID=A0A9N8WD04_FUNMO|nr:4548_t:CDS:2 [Funneliformis mosseae]
MRKVEVDMRIDESTDAMYAENLSLNSLQDEINDNVIIENFHKLKRSPLIRTLLSFYRHLEGKER